MLTMQEIAETPAARAAAEQADLGAHVIGWASDPIGKTVTTLVSGLVLLPLGLVAGYLLYSNLRGMGTGWVIVLAIVAAVLCMAGFYRLVGGLWSLPFTGRGMQLYRDGLVTVRGDTVGKVIPFVGARWQERHYRKGTKQLVSIALGDDRDRYTFPGNYDRGVVTDRVGTLWLDANLPLMQELLADGESVHFGTVVLTAEGIQQGKKLVPYSEITGLRFIGNGEWMAQLSDGGIGAAVNSTSGFRALAAILSARTGLSWT
ncbi:hypothetical protein BI335_03575 [Enemella evansiae]|nr:hypothetical protein BI335_03575 [Enemella evansiae]